MGTRPVFRRAPRRLRLGTRRTRHEGSGCGERGRDRLARARGIPAERRPRVRRDRRRGGRHRLRAPWLSSEHPDAVRVWTTRSTRAVVTTSSSAAGRRSTCVRGPRRGAHRSSCACTAGRACLAIRGSATTRSSRPRRLIAKLAAFDRSRDSNPRSEAFFAAVTGGELPAAPRRRSRGRPRSIRSRRAHRAPPRRRRITPSVISASQRRNVIPGVCEVVVDCRVLPGQTEAGRAARRVRSSATCDYELGSLGARGRDALAARHARFGTSSSRSSPRRSLTHGSCRLATAGSPTAIGCARPSARSRTDSSRCGR